MKNRKMFEASAIGCWILASIGTILSALFIVWVIIKLMQYLGVI